MKLSNKHLSDALNTKKYYNAGVKASYRGKPLNVNLEEFYLGQITKHLTGLVSAEREFENDAEVSRVLFTLFKLAFVDAVRMTKAAKNSIHFETSSYDDEGNNLEAIDESVEYVDELDAQLNTLKPLVSETEFRYLELRINNRMSKSDAAEEMNITSRQADRYLDNTKRKASHLHSGYTAYEFKPYGETAEFRTIEDYFINEFIENQYVGAISSNTFKKVSE